jgi:hypothetical protein
VYLFRGRNYNYKNRPHIRLMLWKPPAPIYPKLVVPAPGGLTKEEADKLRLLGRKLPAIRKLGKYDTSSLHTLQKCYRRILNPTLNLVCGIHERDVGLQRRMVCT